MGTWADSPCLFQFFRACGHQKLMWTAKRSVFQSASIKFVWVKTIQHQHKHIIGWVVAIVGIHHFLDPESYGHLYLPPHVILMIFRFSTQSDSQKSFSEKSWTKQAHERCQVSDPRLVRENNLETRQASHGLCRKQYSKVISLGFRFVRPLVLSAHVAVQMTPARERGDGSGASRELPAAAARKPLGVDRRPSFRLAPYSKTSELWMAREAEMLLGLPMDGAACRGIFGLLGYYQ
jgi:hypothetical protein